MIVRGHPWGCLRCPRRLLSAGRIPALPEPADSSRSTTREVPHGRLRSNARLRAVWLGARAMNARKSHFFRAAIVLLVFFLARPSFATDASCYQAGMATVARNEANIQAGWPYYHRDSVTFSQADAITWVAILKYHYGNSAPGAAGQDTPTFSCGLGENPNNGAPPDNPCTVNAPQSSGGFAGKIVKAWTWCKPGVDTGKGDGSTVSCVMSFQPSGWPTQNQWGSWNTPGSLTATGDTCDGSGDQWKTNTGGEPSDPKPPSPNTAPPAPTPPKTCGGGSCHDPASDQFCGTSGGAQFCVPGGKARGADTAGNPTAGGGGCASSGDSTICAGSPNAPTPPAPPQSPIADPPASVTHIDTYTQANPQTGTNVPISVVTYTNPGGTPSTSGQSSGDRGPAPASSTGGKDGNGASGGGDCTSPPVVTGDAALGMIARQTWYTRCAIEANKVTAHDLDGADRSLGDQTTSPDSVFQESDVGQDGGVLDALDSSGFLGGGRSCPGFPTVKGVGGTDIITDRGVCDGFALLAGFVLAAAYVIAAIIIYRGRAS